MILGYFLAIVIGVTLGLLGGGGAILTIPVLVYIVGFGAKQSIALSLIVVGVASLFGVMTHFKKGNVDLKVALLFAASASVGSFVGAKGALFLDPVIQMTLFSLIMFAASFFMFKGRGDLKPQEVNKTLFFIQAFFVGIVTGVVGVGGGFLIVPVLTLMGGLPMSKAVGTSLVIIFLNCVAAFMGYAGSVEIPMPFIFYFCAMACIGIFIGAHFANKVPQQKLKKGFAVFLIFMSIVVFFKNFSS